MAIEGLATLFTSVKLPVSDYDKASGKGFSILAGYIFGGNDKNEKISMTSPVTMTLEDSITMMFMVPKKFKKETLLGGNYGTHVSLNYSRIVDIGKTALNDSTNIAQTGTDGYKTNFLSMSDSLLYQDLNIEITKKFSKKLKGVFTYQNLIYNQKGKWYNAIRLCQK